MTIIYIINYNLNIKNQLLSNLNLFFLKKNFSDI